MDLDTSKRYGAWSVSELEEFLTETLVPVRLSFVSKNGLIVVPVWFEYCAGCLWSCSPNDSLLVNALRKNPEVAFDVSTNDIPYRGVRGRGLARCSVAPNKTVLEGLLNRYVSGTNNELARWLLARTETEALVEIEISWLTSWDFSDRMRSIEKISARLPGGAL